MDLEAPSREVLQMGLQYSAHERSDAKAEVPSRAIRYNDVVWFVGGTVAQLVSKTSSFAVLQLKKRGG